MLSGWTGQAVLWQYLLDCEIRLACHVFVRHGCCQFRVARCCVWLSSGPSDVVTPVIPDT
eukprot:5416404-Pyramimonas_sp.AAC.1